MPLFPEGTKVVVLKTNRPRTIKTALEYHPANAYVLDDNVAYYEYELRTLAEGEEPKPYYKTSSTEGE